MLTEEHAKWWANRVVQSRKAYQYAIDNGLPVFCFHACVVAVTEHTAKLEAVRDFLAAENVALRGALESSRQKFVLIHVGSPDLTIRQIAANGDREAAAALAAAEQGAEPAILRKAARRWRCACGWEGHESKLRPSPSGAFVCPDCGASGGLVFEHATLTAEPVKEETA